MAKGRATRAGMTRRAVLVVGGVTLLAGYAQDPARRNAEAARTGAAHPTPDPAPGPGRTPSASPTAEPSRAVSTPSARPRLARKDKVRTRPRVAGRGHRGDAGDLPMFHVDDGPKVIALTIDDGPSPVYTPQILRLLDKYQVTATFSMIGLAGGRPPGHGPRGRGRRPHDRQPHLVPPSTWPSSRR